MPGPPITAVVLVNWNGAADTLATLASLDRTDDRAAIRPIVVDNASTDDSCDRIRRQRPDVELLTSRENRGYAAGNDLGIRHALRDPAVARVLVLNNDVEVDRGFLGPLAAAVDEAGVAAAGPKIYFHSAPETIWAAGGDLRLRETVTAERGRGRTDGRRWSEPADVTYLTTCCLLVTRAALEEVGLFDPLFFINVEDADWCRRALDRGLRLRYVPQSRIWHKVATATAGSYTPTKTFHTGRSNTLYVRRHRGLPGMLVFLAANLVALAAALVRELPRGNAGAVLAKAQGIVAGLRERMPPPPRL